VDAVDDSLLTMSSGFQRENLKALGTFSASWNVSRPKRAAINTDIDIDILGSRISINIDIDKDDIEPATIHCHAAKTAHSPLPHHVGYPDCTPKESPLKRNLDPFSRFCAV